MSLLERNQLSPDLKSAQFLEEYFQYAEENSSRCVQWRRMYFGERVDAVLDQTLFSVIQSLRVTNRPRLLRYMQDTPPEDIPHILQLFLNNCFTYHRRSWFCESMVEKVEKDLKDNQITLIEDKDKVTYLFKHWRGSDKVVICVSDDGSSWVFDDWTMNLLHKCCIQGGNSQFLEKSGFRRKLVWDLPPKFFIARIQGMVRYTCFWEILAHFRQELNAPFIRRDRMTEKLVTT